ncbi:MAG: fibronectin type III-like domain-contianing protein, partial [Candidatus Thiodiazotropha endolucinida]
WRGENSPGLPEAGLPGEEGAAAIAEILFGDYNPCGKLTVSMPRSVGQIPLYYNHRPSGGRSHWYNDYVEMSPSQLYPFGHGLSYTTFEYSDLSISANKVATGEQVEISLKVKNTGNMDGTEIVQLYFNDEFAGVPRPVKELKGFARVELNAGESRSVRFRLPVDILAFYDNNLDLIVEAGTIKLMVGSSSADINLEGQFEITGPTRT